MSSDKNKDCGFERGSNWFRYRATAVIIEDGCVLLAGNTGCDYLYSVGGGVHHGETAAEAVLREVFEETGLKYEIDRLAFIHENFFPGDKPFPKGMHCHEVAFYFLMKPLGLKTNISKESLTSAGKEFMEWIPIPELGKYKAYPVFLAEKLMTPSGNIVHIVTSEFDS